MKCQGLFSGKNKKTSCFKLSSAEIYPACKVLMCAPPGTANLYNEIETLFQHVYHIFLKYLDILTLKTPRKPASENVVCLCCLLNSLANFSSLFLHTSKQCGSRS